MDIDALHNDRIAIALRGKRVTELEELLGTSHNGDVRRL